MLWSGPDVGAKVGCACTAKISAIELPTEPADVIRDRRMDYCRHMSEGPRQGIAVIEDVDDKALMDKM